MEYYSAYAMVLYSLGIRAAFYMVLIRFSSSREQWYPDKMVNCCCTQARNALGLFSVGSEIVDAGLALFCGSDLYLARRAVGDGITLARCVSSLCKSIHLWAHIMIKGMPPTSAPGITAWLYFWVPLSGRLSIVACMEREQYCIS